MQEINPSPESTLTVRCDNCKAENSQTTNFCTQCRFPINGTLEDKAAFRSEIGKNKILLKDAEEKINKSRIIILVLAGFSMLMGLIQYFGQEDLAGFIANCIICILYLALAAWCTSNPYGAILTAFILYVTLQVVNFMINPATLFSGIIFKIIYIGALVQGVRSASEARAYVAELKKSKIEPVGSYH